MTIRATAPVRINDLGGWTDTWFAGEGRVLNLAVSPLSEVGILVFENPTKKRERVQIFAENFRLTYSMDPDEPDYRHHGILQGVVNSLPVPEDRELHISVHSSVPAGSSTGSSASVCVALLGALDLLTPGRLSPEEIVSLAHKVETEKLKLQSGIQDQICAAHGGVCFIDMHEYPQASVTPVGLDESTLEELDERLSLIYMGSSHSSSALHEGVIAFLEEQGSGYAAIRRLAELPEAGRKHLIEGDLESYGEVMIRNNELQRTLHKDLISAEADAVIAVAKKHGAAGWKVNGAGGQGGSLTVLGSVDNGERGKMLKEIHDLGHGIETIPISLSPVGLVAEVV